MDIKELIPFLTEGLDKEQADAVRAALDNPKVQSRASELRQAKDLKAIEDAKAALQLELEGDGPQKLGAKAYKEWYEKNFAEVQKLQAREAAYVAKYGSLDNPTTTTPTDPAKPGATNVQLDPAEIAKLVDKRIQEGYAGRWSDLTTQMAEVVQEHMLAGRKSKIDMKKLSELAATKGGNLMDAYAEYDKPEREKSAKEAEDKRIEQRVTEELQKRGASTYFPSVNEPGAMSVHRNSDKSFDKAALERDMMTAFQTGVDPGQLQ